MADRLEMPSWGWGDPDHPRDLPVAALAELERRFGSLTERDVPVGIEGFELPSSNLSDSTESAIRGCVDPDSVSATPLDRILRGGGKSYPDLVRMRAGRPRALPDLVVSPADAEQVGRLLETCSAAGTAVVPFGGGTSVVGGLSAIGGPSGSVVALDLSKLSGVVSVDSESRIATVRAGTPAPLAERVFADQGLTMGHFPQSYLHATVGGFVATRSAGQASTGYGRIDANVLGLEMVTPTGPISLPPMPGTAAGPGLRSLLVGSEGTLGVITEVALQLAKAPTERVDRAWIVSGFERGRELMRRMEQAGCAPTVARLSDEEETSVSLALSASTPIRKAFARYALSRGKGRACLMITSFEGERGGIERAAGDATALLRAGGAKSLGAAPARAWRHGRYDGPYLRDVLMERGLLVDTLETAAPWSQLEALYTAVSDSLRHALGAFGGDPIVMCHVSHLYPGGASLYFTFVGVQPEADPEARVGTWWSVKSAACEAISRAGGTITHHHAVGTDHMPWMGSEVGDRSLAALAALKRELDPEGIMNPGKLLPTAV